MGANIGQIPAKIRPQYGTDEDKLGTVDIHPSIYRQLMVNILATRCATGQLLPPKALTKNPCAPSPTVRLDPRSKAQKLAIVCQQNDAPEQGATLVAGVAGPGLMAAQEGAHDQVLPFKLCRTERRLCGFAGPARVQLPVVLDGSYPQDLRR